MGVWTLGLLAAVLASACAPTKLLKATSDYAAVTQAVTGEVQGAPGILGELCRDSLELQYFTARLIPGQTALTLAEFETAPQPSAHGMTWKQRCAAQRRADDAFLHGLAALGQYGAMLGEFAGDDVAADTKIQALADAAANDAARLEASAGAYHDAIVGLATPLTTLAHAVEGNWKGEKLAALIHRSEPAFHQVIGQLEQFLRVVRERDLRDARVALQDAIHALDQLRADGDLSTAVLTSRFDIEMADRLDALDGQLSAMLDALASLSAAHTKLDEGWQKGESYGRSTLREVAHFSRDAYREIKAFKNPPPGDAQ